MENLKNVGNNQEFNVEITLTYQIQDSKSEVRQGDIMEMEIIENQNLDPSRLPQINEMESKSLTNVLNFIDNTSLCESETKSGITWGQGVVKCLLFKTWNSIDFSDHYIKVFECVITKR